MTEPTNAHPRITPSPRPGLAGLSERWRNRPWIGYATSVAATLVAFGLTAAAQGPLHRVIFVLFYLSVSVAAWIGGMGPALLAIGLAVVAVDYFFIGLSRGFSIRSWDDMIPLVAFAIVSTLIGWLASAQRASALAVDEQTERLQEQNIELEIQMEESQALQEELELTSDDLAEANRDLTRNRDFLEQAQSSALLGSWEWDIKSDTITWSDQMFRVYGLEPGSIQVAYENFSGYVHPDDREMVHHKIADALKNKQSFSYDHRVVWPDGAVRWVHGRGRVIVDANGDAAGMVGSGQDITERRRAAEAQRLLAEASETLAASLDYSQTLRTVTHLAVQDLADWCSIAIGDETGRHSILALAHRDPERTKWAEEYNRLNPPRFDTPTGVPQVLRTGQSEFYPDIPRELLEASARSPEELKVIEELQMRSAMVVPMRARNRIIGAITFIGAESRRRFTADDLWLAERLANRAAIAIDNAHLFEESRKARADAEAANKAKADFLASMSHELRTPLNAIAGYAELIELEVLGPVTDKQRDAVSRVQRSRKHLGALVDQVLNFARIEAGKIDFNLEAVPVHEALQTLADMIAPQAAGKNLQYQFVGCDESVAAHADRDRLDQIVLNLLTNAIKYTQQGGSVLVTVECDDDVVRINVRDTGPGVPLGQQKVIFEPFVQLSPNSGSVASGVGLGLAISRDLARAMGGEVTVVSDPPAGATFTLSLPRSNGQRADPASSGAQTAAGKVPS